MKFKTVICITICTICLQLTAAPKKIKQLVNPKKSAPEVKYDLVLDGKTPIENAVMPLLPKNSKLEHSITEGVYGPADGTKGANINVIYSTSGKTPEIMVFTPMEKGKYKKIKPEILSFGGKDKVEVMSVFFDQADKDSARELFVLCMVTGKKDSRYLTAVFDWTGKEFKRMPAVEAKLKGLYPTINVRKTLRAINGKK